MERTTKDKTAGKKISEQVKSHSKKGPPEKRKEYEGDTTAMVSTGSTLLDLAISGGRVHGGGIPGGILVEIFGPSGTGKTVLLCEIAGAVQRQGGSIMFRDPEARLNKQFARLFDLDVDNMGYSVPKRVPEVFAPIREWNPEGGPIHGIFIDSLAALSTELEMENEEGDKMGMRRAKEFSEECRKTCNVLPEKNYLTVCSNQVRQKGNAGPYEQKYVAPGGEAIGFYSSLRLRCIGSQRKTDKKKIAGKDVSRVMGVETEIEVHKSTVWKPYRRASIYIIFDYGIDDVRANLQYVKHFAKKPKVKDAEGNDKDYTGYHVDGVPFGASIEDAIDEVEENDFEGVLREQVIALWSEIEAKFARERKPKKR